MDGARHSPLSMGLSRREHWSGLSFPSPGDLPDPGIEPGSPALASGHFTAEPPGNPRWPVNGAQGKWTLRFPDGSIFVSMWVDVIFSAV